VAQNLGQKVKESKVKRVAQPTLNAKEFALRFSLLPRSEKKMFNFVVSCFRDWI
jgi:hypothetical protein